MQTALMPDYPASPLFGGTKSRGGSAPEKAPRRGRTENAASAVFDLGVGEPVPNLRRPIGADSLAALNAVAEAAQRMDAAAALIVALCRDNNLPLVPRGIETARYACGDLLHNVDEAMRAHQSVMARG